MNGKLYTHYRDFAGQWRWPHFSPPELACKHCGELYLHEQSLDALERLRAAWGKPIVINSGHRCAAHNLAVGGASGSMHLQIAFDCRCAAAQRQAFMAAARAAGFTCCRAYPAFIHLDLGRERAW